MNLWNKLRERFAPTKPTAPPEDGPGLRNRAGGWARINARIGEPGDGAEVLASRIVRTVAVNEQGFWLVEPPQPFVTRCWVTFHSGTTVPPDTRVIAATIHDRVLDPLLEVPDDAVDEMVAKLGAAPKSPGVPVLSQRHAEDFAKAAAEHYRNNPPVGKMAGQGV